MVPRLCPHFSAPQEPLRLLWRRLEAVPGIRHLFVASGIRMELALQDSAFVRDLVQRRTGGHLKVAPEHTVDHVLDAMGKPGVAVFEAFLAQFTRWRKEGQYLVPYMMSSHPGCTLEDMDRLMAFMDRHQITLEQAQDFIPLPLTVSGAMYHTGLDPRTGRPLFTERGERGRKAQRTRLLPRRNRWNLHAKSGREDSRGTQRVRQHDRPHKRLSRRSRRKRR